MAEKFIKAEAVAMSPDEGEHSVILRAPCEGSPDNLKYFRIFIGACEAFTIKVYSMAKDLDEYQSRIERPGTMDLLCNLFDAFPFKSKRGEPGSIEVRALRIVDIRHSPTSGAVYIGSILLRLNLDDYCLEAELDARPSDLLAIALRLKLLGKGDGSIDISSEVLEQLEDVGSTAKGTDGRTIRELGL